MSLNEDTKNILPQEVETKTTKYKYSHSEILKMADNFLTEALDNDKECSFSLVVLKNDNSEINKKWAVLYQASDRKIAVDDMKKVTERHLVDYVDTDDTKDIKVTKYEQE